MEFYSKFHNFPSRLKLRLCFNPSDINCWC